jgi:pimeloyl-ACP methyl ester carboxylesterase
MASATAPTTHRVGATYRVRGLALTEHYFQARARPQLRPPAHTLAHLLTQTPTMQVPLDHTGVTPGRITVFAREVVAAGTAGTPAAAELPYLVFLQGGPGFESPRVGETGGWVKTACEKFRVLLLDQRGTGNSTRVSAAALARLPSDDAAADFVSHFRADAIVADCEAVRSALGATHFSLLGQSFGGFCACTYLSFHAGALREALITGGLAPLPAQRCPASADAVYASLYPRVATQTAKFYARFPEDVAKVGRIVRHLADAPGGGVALPSGGRLTPRGLQLLGWAFGGAGGFEGVHYLLETAWEADLAAVAAAGSGGGGGGDNATSAAAGEALSLAFLRGYEATLPFDSNPLYALIHEACYANGGATGWAAQRALDACGGTLGAVLDPVAAARAGRAVPFTGEMVFPFMFDDIASLRPLKGVAHALAAREWPASLYDAQALSRNAVPVAATAYYEDMYVDFELAQQTAAGIRGCRVWTTSEYMHSGVREDGARVFGTLLAMARGEEPLR